MSIHVVLDYVYSIEISRNTFTGANTNHVHYQRAHLNLGSNDDVVKIVKSILKTDGATNWEKNVVFGSIVNQYKAVPKDKEILDFNGRWDPVDMGARIVMGYSVKDIENGSLTIDDNYLEVIVSGCYETSYHGFDRVRESIEHDIDERQTNRVVGVDLGKIEPFVATVIDPETKYRSAPYHARYKGRLGSLVEAEKRRRELASYLYDRADLCERYDRTDHADTLRTEAKRVSAKATRIKHEISQCIASQVVSIADQNDAHVSLENLSWLDAKGGRWPHAEIQSRIDNTAKRYGLKVVKVNAKDTSRTCSRCGSKVSNNSKTRVGTCSTCGFSLDRDVSASREIALRATSPSSRSRERMRSLLRQRAQKRSSAAARQSKPVTDLGGIQGHTGTSERDPEATLMMVRETLDSRGSPTQSASVDLLWAEDGEVVVQED